MRRASERMRREPGRDPSDKRGREAPGGPTVTRVEGILGGLTGKWGGGRDSVATQIVWHRCCMGCQPRGEWSFKSNPSSAIQVSP